MGYSHGYKWNDQKIEDDIKNVMRSLGIKRMPTLSEMDETTGDHALSVKVSRTGGVKKWALNLSVPLIDGSTQKGWKGEAIAQDILTSKGFRVEKMPTCHPFDLLVDEVVKIDVKLSNGYISKKGYLMYSFRLEKRIPSCDFYMLIANLGQSQKIYIVPSITTHQIQISIGSTSSKYDKYIDRYDLIRSYCNAIKCWGKTV